MGYHEDGRDRRRRGGGGEEAGQEEEKERESPKSKNPTQRCGEKLLSSPCRIVLFDVFLVCRLSHQFLQCFCGLSTFCTCQLGLPFVLQLRAGVRRAGGGGGGGG